MFLSTAFLSCFLHLGCIVSVYGAPSKGKTHHKRTKASHTAVNRTLDDLKVGDILEGDIMVDRRLLKLIKGSVKRGAIINRANFNRRWPSVLDNHGKQYVRVPYELRKGFWSGLSSKAREAFNKAVKKFHKYTCVRFVPKKPEDNDYIYIYPGEGCWSLVGRRGGKQSISVGKGCEYTGHVMHELMHSLGFLHEQSRMDRDKYVKVYEERVRPSQILNFNKYHQITGGLPYDLLSMLHYNNKDSSANGLNTIESKTEPKMKLGRKNDFSAGDVTRINMLYSCPQLMNDLVDYKVNVKTADTFSAGTDSPVEIDIVGEKGETGEKILETGGYHDDFERGSDADILFTGPYVGKIKNLKFRLSKNSRGWFNGWKPQEVSIKDPITREVASFKLGKWIYPGQHFILTPTSIEPDSKT